MYFLLFWRATGLTNLTLTGINVFLSFVRYFHNGVQCLFPIVLSGAQDFARFPKTSCDFESALLFLKKLKRSCPTDNIALAKVWPYQGSYYKI